MGILEKIADIEKEIAKTQKNKGKTIPILHTSIFRNKLTMANDQNLAIYGHCESLNVVTDSIFQILLYAAYCDQIKVQFTNGYEYQRSLNVIYNTRCQNDHIKRLALCLAWY